MGVVYDEVTIESRGVPIVLSRYMYDHDEAPVVIFLPGTMVHPLFYDSFLRKLCQKGFHVLGVHFLSHGKSPQIKKQFYFEDVMQNARDAIGYAKEHFSGDILLLGSSQGGIIATAIADDSRLCGVLAHDTALPELDESAMILRLPRWLYGVSRLLLQVVKGVARLLPGLPIPLPLYLEGKRITTNQGVIDRMLGDPYCRKSYPLGFLASLFYADMKVATDGRIQIPYVLIAAKGDALFPLEYIHLVYERIVAAPKELMLFDLPYHILFIEEEAEDQVLEPIARKMHDLVRWHDRGENVQHWYGEKLE